MTRKALGCLTLARQRGFLYSQGPPAVRARQEREWRLECRRGHSPILVASKRFLYQPKVLMGHLSVELSGEWCLSRRIWNALSEELTQVELYRMGNRFLVRDFPHQELLQTAALVLEILHHNRPSSEEAFDFPLNLVRGYARCIWAEGMESMMTEGDLYYIREIPNMTGHVLAQRTGELPLVGVHLERFELVGGVAQSVSALAVHSAARLSSSGTPQTPE